MVEARRLQAVGLAAAVFVVASIVCFGLAMGFDPLAGAELVERIVETEAGDADALRWGAVFDIFGYYLLPAVVMIALRRQIPWSSPLAGDLATVGGLAYVTVGAAAAAILAASAPPLIEQGDSGSLETVARVVEGMWQWFEPVPFAAWTVGVALALRRVSSGIANLLWLVSAGAALVLLGQVFDLEIPLAIGLTAWLGGFPLAILLLTRRLVEKPFAS